MRIEIKKNTVFWNFMWLLFGLLAGVVVALMAGTGSDSINKFYDAGAVYDMSSAYRDQSGYAIDYDAGKDVLRVTEDIAAKWFDLSGMKKKWNYIILDISGLNRDTLDITVDYFGKDGALLYSQPAALTEGRNVISSEDVSYAAIQFQIFNQAGAEFNIEKLQFRKEMPNINWQKFWISFVAATLAVLTAVRIFYYFIGKKIDWYGFWDVLQGIYILVGERIGCVIEKINNRTRSVLRTGLLAFQILYMQLMMDMQLYESDKYYKYQMLICSFIILALGALCYEKKLVKVNWRNKLVGMWTILWLLACVSDFIVAKRYAFLGYIMLFVMGFFYFMWNQMENRKQIFREFVHAIMLSFVVTTLFCLLCRPLVEGTRYLGSYYSPGMYAMYVLFVWIAFWADIDVRINTEKKLSPMLLADMAGVALSGYLIWKTQSASGVIPAVLVLGIFGCKQLFLSHSLTVVKRTFRVMVATALIAVPVCLISQWGFHNLPGILGTEVRLEKDEVFTAAEISFGAETVYAAQPGEIEKGSRVLKKFASITDVEEFTSARNWYWAAYLREMNLTGHENKVKMWGKNRWPHSGLLAITYRYGVFAGIPYVMMVFLNLWYAWKYMLRHKKGYGFLMFAVAVAALILILMENLELPFLFLCWVAMYLLMGENFRFASACNSKDCNK